MPAGQIAAKLRTLSAMPDSTHPFLSVYLDTSSRSREGRDALRLFLKNEAKRAAALIVGKEARDSFDADIERIRSLFGSEQRTEGLAVFACHADGFFEIVQARRRFDNQLLVGTRPLIRQLAVLLDEHAPVLAVVIDQRRARIFEITLGDAVHETAIEVEDPGARGSLPKFQGYGDLKYQNRRREKEAEHYHEVGERLRRLMKRWGYKRIVVLGQARNVAAFRKAVDPRVEAAIVGTGHVDKRGSVDAVVAQVMDIVEAEERRQGTELVERIRNQALSGNLGVFGVPAVLDALARGQVYKLALHGRFARKGWRSEADGRLAVHLPSDRDADYREVDLGDELVKAAVAQGAEVEMVDESEELLAMGKVAALLRFGD